MVAKNPKAAANSPNAAKSTQPLGERNTRQRGTIVAILDASDGPLTIPQIHALALKAEKGKKVGIATVYRTLALLVEKGEAKTVILPTGETRYEHAHHDHHHDHFQCRNCQHVYDLHQCPVGLPDGATLPGGFSVESHELTLIGLCPNCTGKSAAMTREAQVKKSGKSKPSPKKTHRS
jgi:Fur family transcriptional regulator, ferric uptake regulator